MTEVEVHRHFIAMVRAAGGQRAFARQVGVTASYINDIIHKRRLLSDRMLAAIGIERMVETTIRYRRVVDSEGE